MRPLSTLSSNRGSGVVDYMMVTVVVAAVVVPVAMKYFGEPIRQSLFNNRQELVGYLAQDRKAPVPNSWFSEEPLPDLPEPRIDPSDTVAESKVEDPSDLPEPQLQQSKSVAQTNIAESNVGEYRVEDGAGSGGGGGGGEGGGGGVRRGGGGSGGGGFRDSSAGAGSQTGSPDFFNKDGKKGGGRDGANKGQVGEAGDDYGSAVGGGEGGRFGRGRSRRRFKGSARGDQDSADESESGAASKRGTSLGAAQQESRSGLAKPFDWWLLVKILIVILIILFLVIILLGSARRN